MIKVLTLLGTRPEAIKMAPVLRVLERHGAVESRLCLTGQHRELLRNVLDEFGIAADVDLDVMELDQDPTSVTTAILSRLAPVIAAERPDWVLIQGDTTSVAAAALTAYHAGVRIGHVEAGLRTYARHPFPEEMNRRLVSLLADLHFAPTPASRANLLAEGVSGERIIVTGNPVIDALHAALQRPYEDRGPLASVPWGKRIILVTAHRRESWGAPLGGIAHALRELVAAHDDVHVVFPIHPNPQVRGPLLHLLHDADGITVTPPLGYLELVHLLWRSTLVLTDSGGLQEEAPALGKPVLVLRESTERREGVDVGATRVVGTDPSTITDAANTLLTDPARYAAMAHAGNPYGDGRAAARIVDGLVAFDAGAGRAEIETRSAWRS